MYDVPNAMQIYQNTLLGRCNFEKAHDRCRYLTEEKGCAIYTKIVKGGKRKHHSSLRCCLFHIKKVDVSKTSAPEKAA